MCRSCLCTIGLQHYEPSVLHITVDSVAAERGANHSSSFQPCRKVGVVTMRGVQTVLATLYTVVCGPVVRHDSDLERHLVVSVPLLIKTRGLLEAGVQSSTSRRGVAHFPFRGVCSIARVKAAGRGEAGTSALGCCGGEWRGLRGDAPPLSLSGTIGGLF